MTSRIYDVFALSLCTLVGLQLAACSIEDEDCRDFGCPSGSVCEANQADEYECVDAPIVEPLAGAAGMPEAGSAGSGGDAPSGGSAGMPEAGSAGSGASAGEGGDSGSGGDVPSGGSAGEGGDAGSGGESMGGSAGSAGQVGVGGQAGQAPMCDTCGLNEYVRFGVCTPCQQGTINAPGDDTCGVDTSCDLIICDVNQRVSNYRCVDCPLGYSNASGDDARDGETTCDPVICDVNQRVLDYRCVECPLGSFNDSGDYARNGETTCDPVLCGTNQYVVGNQCLPCPAGETNEAGDDASGDDTSCDEPVNNCIPGQWQCNNGEQCIPQNYYCDGFLDCQDRSDETNCDAAPEMGTGSCDSPIQLDLEAVLNGSIQGTTLSGLGTHYTVFVPEFYSGQICVDTCQSNFDTVLTVGYTNSAVNACDYEYIGGNDDGCRNGTSILEFTAYGGQYYVVAVRDYSQNSGRNFTLRVTPGGCEGN